MQKLTLRMEAELVQNAKAYAAVHGKSLSQLVADYFSELTRQSASEETLPPLTKSLKGVLSSENSVLDEESYILHMPEKNCPQNKERKASDYQRHPNVSI